VTADPTPTRGTAGARPVAGTIFEPLHDCCQAATRKVQSRRRGVSRGGGGGGGAPQTAGDSCARRGEGAGAERGTPAGSTILLWGA